MRLACPGLREGALLPLGFRRFDVAWSEVYRSAADLAYGADALAG